MERKKWQHEKVMETKRRLKRKIKYNGSGIFKCKIGKKKNIKAKCREEYGTKITVHMYVNIKFVGYYGPSFASSHVTYILHVRVVWFSRPNLASSHLIFINSFTTFTCHIIMLRLIIT